MSWVWISFPFTTPANSFMPGGFVIYWCAYSSGTCHKFCSSFRNFFWDQTLPKTFQVTSLRAFLTTRGCSWPWGFIKMQYSAVIMIPLHIANCQISLEMAAISLFSVTAPPPSSLMANNSRTLIWSFDSWRDHWPAVDTFWQYAPNPFWRHLIVLLFWRL